jgi:hypothetical protein
LICPESHHCRSLQRQQQRQQRQQEQLLNSAVREFGHVTLLDVENSHLLAALGSHHPYSHHVCSIWQASYQPAASWLLSPNSSQTCLQNSPPVAMCSSVDMQLHG